MKITIEGLTKSFGNNNVLKGISFEAESGKALGILGRNGAGKTTVIRIILGVFPCDSGKILIDGKPIDRGAISFGYLPEERGLYPKKTIISQLVYFGMLKNMSRKEALTSADRWLNRMQMGEYKNRRLDTLSKGNQQKIQLAVALISNPDLVILDEPFSGLDPVNAILLKDIVKELIAENKIVLFSSHQMNYIEEFCDNIAILNGGEIMLSGSIKDIKHSYDRSKIIVVSPDNAKIKSYLPYDCYFDTMDENTLIVKLEFPIDKPALLEKLAEGKFDINEIKVYEPTLTDIFVQYTSGTIHTDDNMTAEGKL